MDSTVRNANELLSNFKSTQRHSTAQSKDTVKANSKNIRKCTEIGVYK